MKKEIIIKESAKDKIGNSLERTLREVKKSNIKTEKTSNGINIRRLKNLLILF